MLVQLRLRKRQRHAVIGQEQHKRIVCLTGLIQCSHDRLESVVGPTHRGIVQRQFLFDHIIAGQKTRHGDFVGGEHARRLVFVLWTRVKRFVRIRDIDHQAKRFLSFLCQRDSFGSRFAVACNVFQVAFVAIGIRIQVGVPRIWVIRRRMRCLAANSCKVSGLFG